MAYYVPDLKTMSSLRYYSSIEKARAYAIKKMDEAGIPDYTIFGDAQRIKVVGRIHKTHKMYEIRPIYIWETASGESIVYKNGTLDVRRY